MFQAIIVALVVFLTVGGQELLGFTMIGRPIVIAPLIGLLLGDMTTGLLVGAALETVFMGVVNIGGASSAEPGLAAALATAFAIQMGGRVEVAIALAVPLGIIGLQIKTILYVLVVCPFAARFDRLAAAGDATGIKKLHFGLWGLQWFLYALIPFFALLVGSKATQKVLEMIPDVILHGLSIAGGLLPAVGMAMLMKILWDNNVSVYYFLGFLIIAYFKVPLIAVAVMAVIIAIVVAQGDISKMKLEKEIAKKLSGSGAVDSSGMTASQLENEAFFS